MTLFKTYCNMKIWYLFGGTVCIILYVYTLKLKLYTYQLKILKRDFIHIHLIIRIKLSQIW